MASSRFDPQQPKPRHSSSSGKLLAAAPSLMRLSSSLRGSRVLIFGAEYLNGAHMVRYLIKGGAAEVFCVGPWATAVP